MIKNLGAQSICLTQRSSNVDSSRSFSESKDGVVDDSNELNKKK